MKRLALVVGFALLASSAQATPEVELGGFPMPTKLTYMTRLLFLRKEYDQPKSCRIYEDRDGNVAISGCIVWMRQFDEHIDECKPLTAMPGDKGRNVVPTGCPRTKQ